MEIYLKIYESDAVLFEGLDVNEGLDLYKKIDKNKNGNFFLTWNGCECKWEQAEYKPTPKERT